MSRTLEEIDRDLRIAATTRQNLAAELKKTQSQAARDVLKTRIELLTERIERLLDARSVTRFENDLAAL